MTDTDTDKSAPSPDIVALAKAKEDLAPSHELAETMAVSADPNTAQEGAFRFAITTALNAIFDALIGPADSEALADAVYAARRDAYNSALPQANDMRRKIGIAPLDPMPEARPKPEA